MEARLRSQSWVTRLSSLSSTTQVSEWEAPCTTKCPLRPTCAVVEEAATFEAAEEAGADLVAITVAT